MWHPLPINLAPPHHGGEQTEMQAMQHEQSGLPDTSYEETPLLSGFIHPDEKAMIKAGWDEIKKVYPDANEAKLGPIKLGKERGNQTSLVGKPGNKEYRIFQKDGKTLQGIQLKSSLLKPVPKSA